MSEDMERDFIEIEDDEGNTFELDVIDYFKFEDEAYAILYDREQFDNEDDDECDDEELTQEVYILKVVTDGDYEEFVPPEEDKMDALIAEAEKLLSKINECGCDECTHDHDGE